MKGLYQYIVFFVLGIISVSCGTDLEPEVFPNRSVKTAEEFVLMEEGASDPGLCKRIFVSDTKVYFYYDITSPVLAAYDLQTGEKQEVSLAVEGDDEDESLHFLLCNMLGRGQSGFGGSCWYNGKGYVVDEENIFVYSPDSGAWTYIKSERFNSSNFYNGSNMVMDGDEMVQIASNRMYRLSLATYKWSYVPMTHNFALETNPVLLNADGNLYALDKSEHLLYMYDKTSNLWKEHLSLVYGNQYNDIFAAVLINGNNYYLFSDYSSFIWEQKMKEGTRTLVKIDDIWPYFQNYGWEQSQLFNVGDVCYGISSDGMTLKLVKFGLK